MSALAVRDENAEVVAIILSEDPPVATVEVLDSAAIGRALNLAWTALDGFDDEDVLQQYDVDLSVRALAMDFIHALARTVAPTHTT